MHAAPPEDRLYPMEERQAPMHPEHLADPRAPALDDGVGRGPCATELLRHLHKREQLPALDKLVEGTPGPPQALMGIEAFAVLDRELPQVALPSHAPVVVADEPCSRRIGILGLLEPVGDPPKARARIPAWG